MLRKSVFLPLVVLMFATTQAQAVMVTKVVNFSANSFTTGSGPDPAPVDPVTGQFTITLDDAADVTNQAAGIAFDNLDIVLGSAPVFNYNSVTDRLEVGGASGGASVIFFNPSTNDFWLFINDFLSGTPLFDQMGYTQTAVSSDNLFFTLNQTGSVRVEDFVPNPVVPAPAALPLLASALAAFGLAGWRRRKAA